MISYESARITETKLHIEMIAKRLVDHYDPNRKTVIMLPGGMGSRLERSKKKFPGPFDAYEVVWIDFDIHCDGTVPFWSARLAQTPTDQIYDLELAKDHMSLLEHEETLKVVKRIIDTGKCPKTVTAEDRSLGVSKASRDKTNDFVSKVKKSKIKLGDSQSTDPNTWRTVVEDISLC